MELMMMVSFWGRLHLNKFMPMDLLHNVVLIEEIFFFFCNLDLLDYCLHVLIYSKNKESNFVSWDFLKFSCLKKHRVFHSKLMYLFSPKWPDSLRSGLALQWMHWLFFFFGIWIFIRPSKHENLKGSVGRIQELHDADLKMRAQVLRFR